MLELLRGVGPKCLVADSHFVSHLQSQDCAHTPELFWPHTLKGQSEEREENLAEFIEKCNGFQSSCDPGLKLEHCMRVFWPILLSFRESRHGQQQQQAHYTKELSLGQQMEKLQTVDNVSSQPAKQLLHKNQPA